MSASSEREFLSCRNVIKCIHFWGYSDDSANGTNYFLSVTSRADHRHGRVDGMEIIRGVKPSAKTNKVSGLASAERNSLGINQDFSGRDAERNSGLR